MKTLPRIRARWAGWRLGLAAAATLAVCDTAHGFYWYDWPGSRVRNEPTLIEPRQRNNPANPPSAPPQAQPLPPNPPPVYVPPPGGPDYIPTTPNGPPVDESRPPVGPPEHTPEPTTGLIGLVGLGAIAVRKLLRKR